MIKHKLIWQTPLWSAIVFVLMTCAVLADEAQTQSLRDQPPWVLSLVFKTKLQQSEKTDYFYGSWQNSGISMAVVNVKAHLLAHNLTIDALTNNSWGLEYQALMRKPVALTPRHPKTLGSVS